MLSSFPAVHYHASFVLQDPIQELASAPFATLRQETLAHMLCRPLGKTQGCQDGQHLISLTALTALHAFIPDLITVCCQCLHRLPYLANDSNTRLFTILRGLLGAASLSLYYSAIELLPLKDAGESLRS